MNYLTVKGKSRITALTVMTLMPAMRTGYHYSDPSSVGDASSDTDQIYSYGARSFSIHDFDDYHLSYLMKSSDGWLIF